MSYWRCLILCCRRRVMRQQYQYYDFKYGIRTIYYPEQHPICIRTWEDSLKSSAVLLIMDKTPFSIDTEMS